MRYFGLIFLLLLLSSVIFAQNKVLKFSDKGSFKIVQFTDIHYKYQDQASAVVVDLINEVLDTEKPDLVVFTGDIIWSKQVKEGLDEVFAPVIKRSVPWAYIFGNHDDEFGMSRQQIMDYVVQKPYCLAIGGNKNLDGVGNYILEVKDNKELQNKAILYFFDSGAYTPIKDLGTYNWFGFNQIDWYKKESTAYTMSNGGKPYPALAFFHIPLAEYPLMTSQLDSKIIGEKREDECNGKLNSGMFTAMRQQQDVMATFVGHDHDNDYIGTYYGIALAYGRYSGGKTVYNNLGLNGCRIIEMKEDKREFTTCIRLLGGEKIYKADYPQSFESEASKK